MTSSNVPDSQVHAMRAFNRFYTQRAGVLDPYLSSDLTLTDTRVLYEIAYAKGNIVATDISRTIGIDNGYLSRIIKRFDKAGWIGRMPNPRDQRQSFLSLTEAGKAAFAPLDSRSHEEAAALLGSLSEEERSRLVDSMVNIQTLLSPKPANGVKSATTPTSDPTAVPESPCIKLRDLMPGDLGWVLQVHGEIYDSEWGLNSTFEAVVAEVIVACAKMDPATERGWIAEVNGVRAGSIFLMQSGREGTAKIRLLILTPPARGLGLGARLVDECIAFARSKGYNKIELWTQDVLVAARAIYTKRGFKLVATQPSSHFGKELVGETWEMNL